MWSAGWAGGGRCGCCGGRHIEFFRIWTMNVVTFIVFLNGMLLYAWWKIRIGNIKSWKETFSIHLVCGGVRCDRRWMMGRRRVTGSSYRAKRKGIRKIKYSLYSFLRISINVFPFYSLRSRYITLLLMLLVLCDIIQYIFPLFPLN